MLRKGVPLVLTATRQEAVDKSLRSILLQKCLHVNYCCRRRNRRMAMIPPWRLIVRGLREWVAFLYYREFPKIRFTKPPIFYLSAVELGLLDVPTWFQGHCIYPLSKLYHKYLFGGFRMGNTCTPIADSCFLRIKNFFLIKKKSVSVFPF